MITNDLEFAENEYDKMVQQFQEDAVRFYWLTEDLGASARKRRNRVLDRLSVMSLGAARMAIDDAMAEQDGEDYLAEKKQQEKYDAGDIAIRVWLSFLGLLAVVAIGFGIAGWLA